MENRDSDSAGIDAGFSAAVRNFHAFAEGMGRVSRTSFAQNAKLMDELGAARGIGDVVAIQMKFATGMLETINEQFQFMLSHMAELPAGFAASAPVPLAQGTENTAAPAAPAGDAAASAAEQKPRAQPAARRSGNDPRPTPAGQREPAGIAQPTAKAGRDALQELAKVAAELKRAEAQVRKDVGADNDPGAAPNKGSGPRRA